MSFEEDETTLGRRDETSSLGRAGATSVPALTILWHPQLERIGERALLEALAGRAPVAVTRLTPAFVRPGDTGGRPLGDAHLSRMIPAVEIVRGRTGQQLELLPGPGSDPAEAAGAALTSPLPISAAELASGVVLVLAGSIVLLLHSAADCASRGPNLGLEGQGDAMESVRRLISKVAGLDIPVLVRGETGTGKELVARALVATSPRANRPFIAVNMAAIAATVAVAELFGHEKGAFTGASASQGGYFGSARGGTLFCDEIGSITSDVQEKLLWVLETGEVMPVGAGRARKADVRVLAATDADLERAIAAGRFSHALFHRLAGFQIVLPPLRARRDDFGTLLLYLLGTELATTGESHRLRPETNSGKSWLSAKQVAYLARGSWPGNVRALRNAVRQLVVANRGQPRARIDEVIEKLRGNETAGWANGDPGGRSMAASPVGAPARTPPGRGSNEVGKDELVHALREHDRSPTAAAAFLKISRAKLYGLMERYDLETPASVPDSEIAAAVETHGTDLQRAADMVGISLRSLKLRLARRGPARR
jgi:two-component system nitrogen regulation response regulator GlnG